MPLITLEITLAVPRQRLSGFFCYHTWIIVDARREVVMLVYPRVEDICVDALAVGLVRVSAAGFGGLAEFGAGEGDEVEIPGAAELFVSGATGYL